MLENRNPIECLAEDYFARRRRGEAVSVETFAGEHPEHADGIRKLFPALELLEGQAPPRMAPAVQTLGDYKILREIGRGGMGVVFEARQESLDRHVALKVLPPHAAIDPRFRERFRIEAQAAAGLHHPNIVPVYGVGEEDGVHYYAMQYIDGLGLDQILAEVQRWRPADRESSENPLPLTSVTSRFFAESEPDEGSGVRDAGESSATDRAPTAASGVTSREHYFRSVARVALHTAEALAYAHRQGVLHRDIKPSNLLVDRTGRLWITDFGLCKTEEGGALTQSGELVGSFRYMAPERFTGESDARSDVYGLGVTLYEMLTLRPAFEGSDRARLMKKVMEGTPPRPRRIERDIPRDLETIVLKAMDRFPEARYATAEAMAADLRAYLEARPITARPPTLGYLLWLAAKRNKKLAVTVAVAALLLMIASVVYVVGLDRARRDAEAARMEEARQRENAIHRGVFASLSAAKSALELNEVGEARAHLEAVPPELRRWEWRHLSAGLDRSVMTLSSREDPVRAAVFAVAFSPDGRIFASGSGTLRLWDAESGRQLGILRGHRSAIYGIDFSPDGTRLVSAGSTDRTARIWNVEKRKTLRVLRGHRDEVACARFSRDGRRVATASNDYTIKLWDAASGKEIRTFRGPAVPAASVAFGRDDARLASAYADGSVRVWNVETGALLQTLSGHEGRVHDVVFSPDGSLLASASGDRTVRLWDAGTGEPIRVLRGHTARVSAVAFDPSGRKLASASREHTVKLWDLQSGHEITSFRGHHHFVLSVAFAPDGGRLASGSWSGEAKVWDVEAADAVTLLEGHVGGVISMAVGPDSTLVSGGADATIRLWDLRAEQELAVGIGHTATVQAVAISPDGNQVASGSRDGTIRLWDAATGMELAVLRGHRGWVGSLQFGPRGDVLVSGSRDGTVKIWDPRTWTEKRTLEVSESGVLGCSVSPDGKLIATAQGDGLACVWERETGQRMHTMRGHEGGVGRVRFSPDGSLLATGSGDRAVRLWNVESGEEVAVFTGHTSAVRSLAFHPHEPRLATGGARDGTIRIWDLEWHTLVATWRGHGWVTGVAFSPDGEHLAAATPKGIVIFHADSPVARTPERRRAIQARREVGPLVERLFVERGTTEKVVAALQGNTSLDDVARSAALALARTRAGRADALEQWCWDTVRVPGASRESLARATHLARLFFTASNPAPRLPTAHALSLYRRNRIGAGVDAFRRALGVDATIDPPLAAVNLAFVAALEANRKRPRQAKNALERLRDLLPTIEKVPEDMRALLAEAAALLASSGHKVDWLPAPPVKPDGTRRETKRGSR